MGCIPHTTENYWSGHYFPIVESWDELQISFNLMNYGFYKQAFTSLRSGLELGMLSVYYNINDEGHRTVRNWLNSKRDRSADTPRANQVWKILLANRNIKQFDFVFELQNSYRKLDFLHNYVHTKGAKYSNCYKPIRRGHQEYDENQIIRWMNAFEAIVILVITLHILKYPIAIVKYDWDRKVGIDNPFPVLQEFQVDRLSEVLPKYYWPILEKISENDSDTQEMLEHIYSLPDITEEEVDEQIIEMDKFLIDGMGFVKWEIQERETITEVEAIGIKQNTDRIVKRISRLREWAEEEGKMQGALERE
jgi:hypothetical protein